VRAGAREALASDRKGIAQRAGYTCAFLAKGYDTVAIDASVKMVEAARVRTDCSVLLMRFQEIEWADEFDGIWACASLLHEPRTEMDDIWRRLIRALKPGGVWFMSFKQGAAEGVRSGRFFNDYGEDELRALLDEHEQLTLLRLWTTQDAHGARTRALDKCGVEAAVVSCQAFSANREWGGD